MYTIKVEVGWKDYPRANAGGELQYKKMLLRYFLLG
jgi:hypothetical protein